MYEDHQPMLGQQPPFFGQGGNAYHQQQHSLFCYQEEHVMNPTLLQQREQNRGGGMGNGAKVALAAAGGLAVGAGGMYLAEHMDDVGQAFGSAEHWMGGAVHDVEGFAEHFVEDIF